jgi:hypothetical protein
MVAVRKQFNATASVGMLSLIALSMFDRFVNPDHAWFDPVCYTWLGAFLAVFAITTYRLRCNREAQQSKGPNRSDAISDA